MSEQVVISMEGESYSFVSSAITFILCLTAILTAYHYWFKNLRHVKLTDNIPSPRTLPILGHIHMGIGKSPTDVYDLVYDLYHKLNSDIVKLYFGPKLYIGICSAEDAELILGSSVHLEKPQEYRLFEPWLGDGLLISKGEKWRSHRKMIAPTFHTSILKSFMPVFNKNANNLVEQFKKEKKVFDVHNQMSAVTVDTLLETSMGVVKTDEDNTGFDYAMAVMDMCNILHLRHYKVWLRLDFLFRWTKMFTHQKNLLNIIHSLTRQVIKRKKEDYMARKKSGETSLYMRAVKTGDYEDNQGSQEIMTNYIKDDLDENDDNDVGEKKRLAFLDFMIEASQTGNNITDEEIKEEVDTIMFEGHDTTAAGSSFALCLLGIHQDIQQKVYEELKDIFQDNMDRPITFADTINMKYLERVILETLRLYPPVPLIGRKVLEDVKLVTGDYIIPAGTSVGICQVLIHRNKKYYKDPLKFDPDNFLPERCQERPYYAYVPFSAGPRSCVGRKYAMLKLKVLLAGVLRKFQIHCSETEEDFKLQADIILKKTGGFNISVTERKH
ncbi:cytochrome P450 monooxygenase CYP4G7 [Leptinotarsa decemlineata]